MTTNRCLRLPLLAGTAAAALLLTACGSDDTSTTPAAPAAPATSATAPSTSPPATIPSASAPSSSASASDDDDDDSASATPSPSGSSTTVPENDAELDVDDQRGDGTSVRIDEVRLAQGTGFVAVYTRDGQLLGSAEVGSGRTLTVDLDDPITRSGEYRAVLFADDGDGSFDPETDLRVLEADDDSDDDDDDTDDAVDDDFDYTVR